jgi:hypothetical protein
MLRNRNGPPAQRELKRKGNNITKLFNNDMDNITGKMISQADDKGDAFKRLFKKQHMAWVGIASVVNWLIPERVILCGE